MARLEIDLSLFLSRGFLMNGGFGGHFLLPSFSELGIPGTK